MSKGKEVSLYGWEIKKKNTGYVVVMPNDRGGIYVDRSSSDSDDSSLADIVLYELAKAIDEARKGSGLYLQRGDIHMLAFNQLKDN